MPWGSETHARPKGHHYRSRPLGQEDETSQMSCCFAPNLSAGVCVKRYGPRLPIKHDYFDKDLSRKGAAPATGRDTLIKLQGRGNWTPRKQEDREQYREAFICAAHAAGCRRNFGRLKQPKITSGKMPFFGVFGSKFSSRGYRPAPLFGRTPPSAVTRRRPPGRLTRVEVTR